MRYFKTDKFIAKPGFYVKIMTNLSYQFSDLLVRCISDEAGFGCFNRWVPQSQMCYQWLQGGRDTVCVGSATPSTRFLDFTKRLSALCLLAENEGFGSSRPCRY